MRYATTLSLLAMAASALADYNSSMLTNGTTSYTTEIVTALTTYCPLPTEITQGDVVYTVTEATTLTITNCPCTSVYAVPCPATPSPGPGPAPAPAPSPAPAPAASQGQVTAVVENSTPAANNVPAQTAVTTGYVMAGAAGLDVRTGAALGLAGLVGMMGLLL